MHARIELNPQICHGKPVIKGTRVMACQGWMVYNCGAASFFGSTPDCNRFDQPRGA